MSKETVDLPEQARQRREKLAALREQGNAFPNDFRRDALAGDLLGQPVASERFKRFNDLGMEHPPPFLQQTAVRHVMGKGMFEGIHSLWKQTRLVQKLSGLKMCQATIQRLFGYLSDGLK